MWSKALDLALRRMFCHGDLAVELPDGTHRRYGDATGDPVTVRIHDAAMVRRLVTDPELALGEGYMDGTITIDGDDLHGFLEMAIRNLQADQRVWWQDIKFRTRALLRSLMQNNAPSLARKNVAHHYDLSGKLYELFLDADRQYSCAYFRSANDTLEEAQANKKAHIAAKLSLRPGMRVLDIGCGWGGMALTLAREYGARVTGITLSEEQLAYARARVEAAGLTDRVDFHLRDFRDVRETFDRIVSVGMFEHVGLPHYDAYFRTIHDCLAPDGVALVHTIGVSHAPSGTNPWIAKYIFPGGYTPSLSELTAAIERRNLWITDVEVLRLHYAETLHHWYDRFEANVDKVRALYGERFVRMWRFYLVACEQAFRYRRQGVYQVQLTRDIGALPMTRDYIYADISTPKIRSAAE